MRAKLPRSERGRKRARERERKRESETYASCPQYSLNANDVEYPPAQLSRAGFREQGQRVLDSYWRSVVCQLRTRNARTYAPPCGFRVTLRSKTWSKGPQTRAIGEHTCAKMCIHMRPGANRLVDRCALCAS